MKARAASMMKYSPSNDLLWEAASRVEKPHLRKQDSWDSDIGCTAD